MEIPTVFVEGQDGPLMINLSDYDPAVHTLCADQELPATPAAEPIPDYVEPSTVHPATVTVQGQDGGSLIINASDYDPEVHTLLDGEPVAPAAPVPPAPIPVEHPVDPVAPVAPAGDPVAPVPPAAPVYGVKKIGRAFFVAVGDEKAVADWIAPTGYKTDNDAWAAILANQSN